MKKSVIKREFIRCPRNLPIEYRVLSKERAKTIYYGEFRDFSLKGGIIASNGCRVGDTVKFEIATCYNSEIQGKGKITKEVENGFVMEFEDMDLDSFNILERTYRDPDSFKIMG